MPGNDRNQPMNTTPDFPVLDATYAVANDELGRHVIAELGAIEPHIDELDSWCLLPLRLVVDQAAGLHIEVGPYSLSELDIERLRAAIAAYDLAVGRQEAR